VERRQKDEQMIERGKRRLIFSFEMRISWACESVENETMA
jgi:hypothetical protein